MDKFRILSDLHIDMTVNKDYPLSYNDDVFTVICGDTSGTPSESISWINANITHGVCCSGNHLPYNTENKTIQELREELEIAFPEKSNITYLDCETSVFSKNVDGILFIGTCMYSNMAIKHPEFNPTGDIKLNKTCSFRHMNDYRWGIKSKIFEFGLDNEPTLKKITPDDYYEWFSNAYSKIEKLLNENEQSKNPLPVVLFTHYPLITDFIDHNSYMSNTEYISDYNWPSYANDMKLWLLRHTSIKCYCCGHIHAVNKEYRHFYINREDKSKILIVNNARGYLRELHDTYFNPNLFVNVNSWSVEETPLSKTEIKRRKKCEQEALAYSSIFF